MAKRYLRLEEASDKLQALGLPTGRDYYALTTDNNTVMGQTMWRQSQSAARSGKSRAYSFWLAVRRYWGPGGGPKRRAKTSTNIVQGPGARSTARRRS